MKEDKDSILKEEEKRTRFHTTLKPSARRNLRLIAALKGLKAENDVIEFLASNYIKEREMDVD